MNPNLPPHIKYEVRMHGVPQKKYFYGYQLNNFMRRLRLTLGELNIDHTL